MKAFFAGMNFVRAVMLMCFVAAAALGYMAYNARAEVTDLREQVNVSAAKLANQIQQLAVNLNQLQKVESGSEFEAVNDTQQYIRQTATLKTVGVGFVDITPGKPRENVVPGTKDQTWGIRPQERTTVFSHSQISNFLYMLEVRSPFIIVTHAEFRLEKKGKPEEYPSDRWTYEADVTIRSPLN